MIMGRFKFIYIGFAFMAAACSVNGADYRADSGDIQLCVAVDDMQINSRTVADPYLGTTPSALKPLDTAVWFRKADGVYDDNPTEPTYLPVHTGVTFDGPQLEYVLIGTNNLQYPTDNSRVCCVGLYPNDGRWTTTDGVNLSHSIDGHDDLMFAGENFGTWNDHIDPLRYEHLLTWVKIAVCATSHDTAEAWGEIEQISINSKATVTVNSRNVETIPASTLTEHCEYTGEKTIKTMGASAHLYTTMHEVGSVLCSPEKQYTLTIKTSNNPEPKVVTLDLSMLDASGDSLTDIGDASEARGKCFVLSLYFKPYNVVEGVCVLNAWNNQNEDIYLTTE